MIINGHILFQYLIFVFIAFARLLKKLYFNINQFCSDYHSSIILWWLPILRLHGLHAIHLLLLHELLLTCTLHHRLLLVWVQLWRHTWLARLITGLVDWLSLNHLTLNNHCLAWNATGSDIPDYGYLLHSSTIIFITTAIIVMTSASADARYYTSNTNAAIDDAED